MGSFSPFSPPTVQGQITLAVDGSAFEHAFDVVGLALFLEVAAPRDALHRR
jgi:hypothetical protein